ncbi:4-hydroxybutyrate dehydrogenase [Pandoraea anhela]|uniref:4-hydroxybutyrate dehydrogenase n=2 Tax=Pandoraea anhela TaxID=2508295 RepID=A0A5E4RDE1_9BURK|nr:4-hydroxybutyrate dehydrogenase [Pandoraea anhela]
MQQDAGLNRLARAMGRGAGGDVGPAIAEMTAKRHVRGGFAELGVTRERFPRIIEGALQDNSHKPHPRDASAEDYREMLDASMSSAPGCADELCTSPHCPIVLRKFIWLRQDIQTPGF